MADRLGALSGAGAESARACLLARLRVHVYSAGRALRLAVGSSLQQAAAHAQTEPASEKERARCA